MDDLARFNKERWEALSQTGFQYARPLLDLDPASARQLIDPHELLGEVRGRRVLCLASGGGQQSAAFGLLGAKVTMFDLSEAQLQKDALVAAHYGFPIQLEQGDMRDLSRFGAAQFDIVYHAYSLNFVPDPRPALREASRMLRPNGWYRLEFANPFIVGTDERSWNGTGYLLSESYVDGAEVYVDDPHWDVYDEAGQHHRLVGPREFRHALSTLVNTLVAVGLVVRGLWEEMTQQADLALGSWEHYTSIAPPYLTIWAVKDERHDDRRG